MNRCRIDISARLQLLGHAGHGRRLLVELLANSQAEIEVVREPPSASCTPCSRHIYTRMPRLKDRGGMAYSTAFTYPPPLLSSSPPSSSIRCYRRRIPPRYAHRTYGAQEQGRMPRPPPSLAFSAGDALRSTRVPARHGADIATALSLIEERRDAHIMIFCC